ncbi:virulence factor Mce [Nocardia jinanensis]|uniref:Virulence factor Mce n=1 Tax=Nocardia jinanensis TaxID=382504 RepID=A0A917RP98_9NOCA|nr:virulence factor Mce [Nocardia jinanensis]
MLLSRFVRAQLVIFSILSVIGLVVMSVIYMKLPTLAGVGTMDVAVELPEAGGLYRFGNVTYRGIQVGKVTRVDLTEDGVRAVLAIDGSHRIPADLTAEVRSVSAVGEQYVDLLPRTDSPPYLYDGATIERRDTEIPQPVGPMLDRLSALVGTIPKDDLRRLLDEMFAGVHGASDDLDSLLSSAEKLTATMNGVGDSTRTLVEDAVPLLDSQVQSADAIRIWTRATANVTGQLVADDPQLRTLLHSGPGFAGEVSQLLDSLQLTLPVLLSNLTSVGQLAVTYNAGLEQLLVLLPPAVSLVQAVQPTKNASGLGIGDFRVSGVSDPPACTVGFLPPSEWRSPQDVTTIDTPDNLYCKLPQDHSVAVRGARNIPCAGHPGKRAPTAEICNSDQDYVPVAPEQPVVGPYPRDPELEEQGIPPDSRFAPPPGNAPAADTTAPGGTAPAVAFAQYDPNTGEYMGPDGQLYRQTDLVADSHSSWEEMLPR